MIWAGISLEAHTDLVFVENGAMTAHRYILECVESHVVPYVPFIGENFLFMDDNARPTWRELSFDIWNKLVYDFFRGQPIVPT
jgi:hypothetical protein